MSKDKSVMKTMASSAKKRLSNGYWEDYYNMINEVKTVGTDAEVSKVVNYYEQKAKTQILKNNNQEENFYLKVKDFLDKNGEAGNALGYLTDKEYYNSLDYEKQQRYNLELSEKYRTALERYRQEKEIERLKNQDK